MMLGGSNKLRMEREEQMKNRKKGIEKGNIGKTPKIKEKENREKENGEH
jgi:hypothetical protein